MYALVDRWARPRRLGRMEERRMADVGDELFVGKTSDERGMKSWSVVSYGPKQYYSTPEK